MADIPGQTGEPCVAGQLPEIASDASKKELGVFRKILVSLEAPLG
jgi:hypothetical protein